MPLKVLQVAPALTDQVREAIIDAIIDGTFKPGTRLAQEDLADRLGVSRQPVSHALMVLKEQGVLVELGRKGLTVAPLEAGRISALYQVRAALDGLAARLAAERQEAGLTDTTLMADLQALCGHHLTAPESMTVPALIDADVAFHSGVHRLSGNAALTETIAPMWIHFRRSMASVLSMREGRGRIWQEHREILDAIAAGKAKKAEKLARAHAEAAGLETARRLTAA